MSSEGPSPQDQVGSPSPGEGGEQSTVPEQEYEGQAEGTEEPDVLLDVPVLKVEELNLELQDLRAHISLRTELAGLVKINVGVDAYLNTVKLEIKGIEAQALLKVRLERILDTFDRALATIDSNPEIVGELVRSASGALSEPDSEEERPGQDLAPDEAEETSDAVPEPTSGARGGGEESSTVRRPLEGTDDVIETTLDSSSNVVEEEVLPAGENSAGGEEQANVTQAAARMARELGVDPAGIEGSGSGGRVLVRDVQRAAQGE